MPFVTAAENVTLFRTVLVSKERFFNSISEFQTLIRENYFWPIVAEARKHLSRAELPGIENHYSSLSEYKMRISTSADVLITADHQSVLTEFPTYAQRFQREPIRTKNKRQCCLSKP